MATGFVIRKNQYYDSVFLMGISKRISEAEGVRQNAVLMGSDTNKELLLKIGIHDTQIDAAQPNDLIVAVVADTEAAITSVLGSLDIYLAGGVPVSATSNPHSLEEGLVQKPRANLAVISVPGEYAAREARKALEAGLNVFLFSDNVSLEDECELKQFATQKRLLVMGPDCGTSLIGGAGIGFANVVQKGPIGAIGAAGTGLQEFTSQVHNAGSGISHAIGTGGHDLSDRIGGLTTFAALEALEADPQTRVIAVISKPPGRQTLTRLVERFRTCTKPIIACFLGCKRNQTAFIRMQKQSTKPFGWQSMRPEERHHAVLHSLWRRQTGSSRKDLPGCRRKNTCAAYWQAVRSATSPSRSSERLGFRFIPTRHWKAIPSFPTRTAAWDTRS